MVVEERERCHAIGCENDIEYENYTLCHYHFKLWIEASMEGRRRTFEDYENHAQFRIERGEPYFPGFKCSID